MLLPKDGSAPHRTSSTSSVHSWLPEGAPAQIFELLPLPRYSLLIDVCLLQQHNCTLLSAHQGLLNAAEGGDVDSANPKLASINVRWCRALHFVMLGQDTVVSVTPVMSSRCHAAPIRHFTSTRFRLVFRGLSQDHSRTTSTFTTSVLHLLSQR